MISLLHYLIISALLFGLSLAGLIINRSHVIKALVCVELMLLAVNFNFVAFSHYFNDLAGQVFVFFVLTVAAAEAAIGLAIIVALYRNRASITIDALDQLKG